MNNLPKVVTQQRRGRASNPRLLDRKSDALPLSHRATKLVVILNKILEQRSVTMLFEDNNVGVCVVVVGCRRPVQCVQLVRVTRNVTILEHRIRDYR